jgi:flagellar hook-associated protein 2
VATPLFSVGGLASGLDTSSMITQLMNVERAPVTALQQRKADYQARSDAWGSIRTRLSSLRTSVDALKNVTDLDKFATVASSNPDAVSVVTTDSSVTGATSASFKVEALAARHQVVAQGSFSGLDSLVGTGTFTLTSGGVAHPIQTTDSTTLSELVGQINALGAGVQANAVAVGSSGYRLLLSASQTGADAAFTVSGTESSLSAFDVVEQGANSRIVIGSGAGAITLERPTNTVSDLVSGATITLKATTTSAVSVDVTPDVGAAVNAVKSLVSELNKTIGSIDDLTSYNADTKKAGKLQGEQAAWQIATDLRSQVSALSASVGGASAPTIGITISRDGTFTVDEDKLRAAFESDFRGTAAVLGRSATSPDSRVQFVRSNDDTVAGTYPVAISAAASRPTVTGSAYTPPSSNDAFVVTQDGRTVNIVVNAGSDLQSALAQINAALAAAGVATVRATNNGGAIQLQDSRYGAKIGFTVAGGSLGLAGTYSGSDVVGTIGGVAATGIGQSLTAATGAAKGFQVRVTASQSEVDAAGGSLSLGSPVYQEGIAGRLSRYLATAEGLSGTITTATDRWASQIKLLDEQIADYNVRLDQRETALRSQLTAMESTMSKLQQQGNWLSQQLASL